MTMNEGMYSSKHIEYSTPPDFFAKVDDIFHFTLDACASIDNFKCFEYYTIYNDALERDWPGSVWCNPPYGKEISKWVKKAYKESRNQLGCVVMLIPARTDTKYWHDYVMKSKRIWFVRGRLNFNGIGPAPFPSAVVWFDGMDHEPLIRSMDRL